LLILSRASVSVIGSDARVKTRVVTTERVSAGATVIRRSHVTRSRPCCSLNTRGTHRSQDSIGSLDRKSPVGTPGQVGICRARVVAFVAIVERSRARRV
jgi:hypothetical protein